MKQHLILLLSVIVLSCFCCTKGNNSDIKIDLNIKLEAKKHISNVSLAPFFEEKPTAYYNEIDLEIYSGKSDTPQVFRSDTTEVEFNSFYYTKNDTTILFGSYELGAQFGFIIKVINDQFEVYHLVASLNELRYSLSEGEDWENYVEVPCLESKVILSQKPSSKTNEAIYGYIELKSMNYYHEIINLNDTPQDPTDDEIEIMKSRSNMKTYFKSIYVDYE